MENFLEDKINMIHEISLYKCMMLERPLTISNFAAHDISHNICIWDTCPHSLSMEYKIEFASTQFPDVDSSDGKAVCSTISKMGSSPILA